jgi:hypothetical protein
MESIILSIAMLCQIHADASAEKVAIMQEKCQRQLATCTAQEHKLYDWHYSLFECVKK